MEEVGLQKVAHNTGNMSKYVESTAVSTMVPVLDPAGFIGQRGNSLATLKIDDLSSEPSH